MWVIISICAAIIFILGLYMIAENDALKNENQELREGLDHIKNEYRLEKYHNNAGYVLAGVLNDKMPIEYQEYGQVKPESVEWFEDYLVEKCRHRYVIRFETER